MHNTAPEDKHNHEHSLLPPSFSKLWILNTPWHGMEYSFGLFESPAMPVSSSSLTISSSGTVQALPCGSQTWHVINMSLDKSKTQHHLGYCEGSSLQSASSSTRIHVYNLGKWVYALHASLVLLELLSHNCVTVLSSQALQSWLVNFLWSQTWVSAYHLAPNSVLTLAWRVLMRNLGLMETEVKRHRQTPNK